MLYNDYYGKEEYEKYHEQVCEELAGVKISKAIQGADLPGGLIYEANKLNMDMWDLLACLEGMCYNREATEIDDSTYLIIG